MNPWNALRRLAADEPAILAWAASGGLAGLLAVFVHLSPVQMGAVATIATALAAAFTAARARPVGVAALTGALATIATAAAAFGLHLPTALIGSVAAFASAVLGLVLRANVSPLKPSAPPK